MQEQANWNNAAETETVTGWHDAANDSEVVSSWENESVEGWEAEGSNDVTFESIQPRRPYDPKDNVFKLPRGLVTEAHPIVAIDTEYTASACGTENNILSYQFAIRFKGQMTTLILYPDNHRKGGRLDLDHCLVQAIEHAITEGVLECWPEMVIACAHFLRADLFNFNKAFSGVQEAVNSVRKTVVSLDKAYGVDVEKVSCRRIDKQPIKVWDSNRNSRHLLLQWYDTMLLCPNGKSLADVGELLGLSKLEIPAPYSIERMDEYLEADKAGFEAYALRDAEVAALHMERVIEFCASLGIKRVPFTIGGIAVKAFTETLSDPKAYRRLFGFEEVTKEIWPEGRNQPLTITSDVACDERLILEDFATRCYHGGRNESFVSGPTAEDTWNDFDAPSCYTSILIGLRQLDYDNMFMTHNLKELFGDKCALARVSFKFPAGTRFPSLPVRTESFGLIYPLEGVTYCTGHELEVAYNQGAEITVKQGFVVPWLNQASIFEPFMQWVRQQRLAHEKGSFDERLFKECGNSVYGKLAQGLRRKTSFEVESGLNKPLLPSTLTNPFFAAYTTGLARALMSEMLNGVPSHRTVVSVTTDGFLTDAELDEINLSGPISNRFRGFFHRIDPNGGEILELKHRASQLIAMKTRGQLTAKQSNGYAEVLAKAGVKTPKGETDPNAFMVNLYLNRVPGQLTDVSHLTSTREMFLGRKDMLMKEKESRLNLEPDWKRRLVSPRMQSVRNTEHIAFESMPFQNVDEMMFNRLRFDRWRLNHCLKTMDDWHNLEDRMAMAEALSEAKLTKVRIKAEERSDELMRRLFLRFYARKSHGLEGATLNANQLAKWLTDEGYVTKATAVRGAKRQKLVEAAVPITAHTLKLLGVIRSRFPEFNYEAMFRKSDLPLLRSFVELCS
ncbi:hypothetical protein [Photobacterium rosenbergii]|uniref:DNA-directed DNA polymerase n=1 Tax=Photobacterium rosenbergii TaxID=294936 RepID=A0ABU3ZLH4_9GAMM|nr:hypothetical protein [Photobacterium rosenbergii]MDV5170981.1 hypothetical protein [Photobacterium rosenbergii]